MRWSIAAAFLLSLLLLAPTGCEPPQPKPKPTATSGPVVVPQGGAPIASNPPAVVASQLSDAQKKLFVESMLKVASGQSVPNDFLDVDKLFAKTAELVGVPQSQREGYVNATKRGYANNSLAKIVISETSKGGSFHFLRYSQRDGYETAIFRYLRADTALSYFEFAMPPSNAANFSVAPDVYTYINSEWMSQTSANVTLQLKAAEDPSVLNKLFRGAGFSSSDSNAFKTIIDKGKIQDWRGVITAYHTLPAAIKQSKIGLMFRFNAATRLQDNAEITSVVEDLRKYCGNEPAIDFLSLDYHLIRKEFGKAMSSLDGLARSVGGDPYIDVLRGNVSLQAGDVDQALAAGKRAAESEPTLESAYALIATAAQSKRDFATVAEAFKSLQSMGKATPADVAATPEYAPFAASPEFKAWSEGR